MDFSDLLSSVHSIHAEARRRRLFFQHGAQEVSDGRRVRVNGRSMLWFGSCSYLGLEREPALVEGAIEALRRHGTQFASSRGYVSLALHQELEELLSQMFGAPALIGQTTTLAHDAALDVLVTDKDGLVLDHQVHASVQRAATQAKAHGAAVETVNHERLDEAMDRIERLSRTRQRVWFACDGVTSMYGDLAPYSLLADILDIAPNVHLYVDDAHGTGWAGRHGRGRFLELFPAAGSRVVVATSLAKSFAAGGGALILPDEALRERIRLCGSTMVFSGPLQPPLLGAAVASARLHLGPTLEARQRALAERVDLLRVGLRDAGVPVLADNDAPISFLPVGKPEVVFDLAEALAERGFFVNPSIFPSVPMRRAGLRVALTNALELDDIRAFTATCGEVFEEVLPRFALSVEEIRETFSAAVVGPLRQPVGAPRGPRLEAGGRPVEHARSARELDAEEWDALLGDAACVSHASLLTQEEAQAGAAEPWRFHHLLVRGDDGRPLAAAPFTELRLKLDMLSRAEVSAEVERRRLERPGFLEVRALMMGTGLSEGMHLHLDRTRPWQGALLSLLDEAVRIRDESGLELLMLRDLPRGDPELDTLLIGQGFVRSDMPSRYLIEVKHDSVEAHVRALPRASRKRMLQRLAEHEDFVVQVIEPGASPPPGGLPLDRMAEMYRDVARRNLRINTCLLPDALLRGLVGSEAWEIVLLGLRSGARTRPVAWYAAHRHERVYTPLLCGLDYEHVWRHGAYRQMLLTILCRAWEVGARSIHLGMDADQEKRTLGAVASPTCAWILGGPRFTFDAALLREVTEHVGLGQRERR